MPSGFLKYTCITYFSLSYQITLTITGIIKTSITGLFETSFQVSMTGLDWLFNGNTLIVGGTRLSVMDRL
jgi:hypothetical protein